ncbi:hypothetical protein X740_31025 [Mesorhizobium sp. LNHC221B00]|uniref:hypothetical protein n=1 Tax=Mesorhizobium sp. LNHC221B00 TaxID=1287233 RepID=UPI0003CE8CAB|nr:hypothetical protein [Mesorhizobium sp. LNHC221B00]ESY75539.1 hypothetical protein X740_31025 [Mesorhizobium sp. LNHC221B00]
MSCSFRHLLNSLIGKAGRLGGIGEIGTGRDAEGCGVEIVKVAGGGPLRLRDRFSRERERLSSDKEG